MILQRLTHIDLLRGACAIMILVVHFPFLYASGYQISDLPMSKILGPVYSHGGIAVTIFWVISGFVFAAIYGDGNIAPKEFFVRRFARLYPLHFVTLLFVGLLQITVSEPLIYPNNDMKHFIAQLFFASNWGAGHDYSFNGPIWSVSAEVLVYALFLGFSKTGGGA